MITALFQPARFLKAKQFLPAIPDKILIRIHPILNIYVFINADVVCVYINYLTEVIIDYMILKLWAFLAAGL